MNNHTSISTFLLLEFSHIRELQILHFLVFLALYTTTLIGNLLIIITVALDSHLHTPMYFFLFNLAILDIGTISVTVPKSMAMSLISNGSISYSGCVGQVFFCFFFLTSEFIVLTIMAHDRYIAICSPLYYERIMHKRACIRMLAVALTVSLIYATVHTGGTFANTFCSNDVNQFFCEVPQLLKLSCSDLYLVEAGLLLLGCSMTLGCFIFIVITYVQVFDTVFPIPSVQSQRKALSTCFPHLTVVTLFILSGVFAYARPPNGASSTLDIVFAVMYAVISPMSNPFIYSMRSKEIKTSLKKLLDIMLSCKIM